METSHAVSHVRTRDTGTRTAMAALYREGRDTALLDRDTRVAFAGLLIQVELRAVECRVPAHRVELSAEPPGPAVPIGQV